MKTISQFNTFVWVTPAWGRFSTLDHTWVTSYDCRVSPYPTIHDVINANELYWYCNGDFHITGRTPRYNDGLVFKRTLNHEIARCLVGSNNPNESGTIEWYGIDGVCHQVTNQVIYNANIGIPDPLKAKKVRGYTLSSAIYGKFGRRKDAWYEKTVRCCPELIYKYPTFTEFVQRLMTSLKVRSDDERVTQLELMRIELLSDIDDIGYAERSELDETTTHRANQINDRINDFISETSEWFSNSPQEFYNIFGIQLDERMDLVDPNLFEFPNE